MAPGTTSRSTSQEKEAVLGNPTDSAGDSENILQNNTGVLGGTAESRGYSGPSSTEPHTPHPGTRFNIDHPNIDSSASNPPNPSSPSNGVNGGGNRKLPLLNTNGSPTGNDTPSPAVKAALSKYENYFLNNFPSEDATYFQVQNWLESFYTGELGQRTTESPAGNSKDQHRPQCPDAIGFIFYTGKAIYDISRESIAFQLVEAGLQDPDASYLVAAIMEAKSIQKKKDIEGVKKQSFFTKNLTMRRRSKEKPNGTGKKQNIVDLFPPVGANEGDENNGGSAIGGAPNTDADNAARNANGGTTNDAAANGKGSGRRPLSRFLGGGAGSGSKLS